MKWLIGSLTTVAAVALLPANATAAVPSNAAAAVPAPYKVQGWLTEIESTPGSDTLWSIKQVGAADDGNYQLAAYRPGSGWTAYDVPAGPHRTYVTDIGMASETDGWATGGENGMLRWDGTSWERQQIAAMGSGDYAESVSVAGADDVWVVGSHRVDSSTYAARAWHFDGTGWSRATIPLGADDTIDDVLAVGADDVWISGSSWDGGADTALTLHWHGGWWQQEPLPGNPSWTVQLAASSPDSVWLVASDGTNRLLRWDGTRWSVAAQAGEPPYDPVAIDTVPGGDMWSFNSYRYLSRTDGTSWSWDKLNPSCQWDRDYGMGDIEVVAPDDIYIVGACWGWRTYTAAYHFDGEHFTRI